VTLKLLIKLLIATNIVLRPFSSHPFYGLHSHCGYANFGFKAIASNGNKNSCNGRKYGDRDLYNGTANFAAQVLQGQKPSFALVQRFGVQKAGNVVAECEDIWHFTNRDRMLAIALSDGATESSFSREWAKELVTTFVDRNHAYGYISDGEIQNWLIKSQTTWQGWLANQNLTWFAKRKAGEGAFATFLSLEIFPDLGWKTLAMGDSCLFVVRNHTLQKSFPLQHSNEFNNRPRLIGTSIKPTNITISQTNGNAQLGDRFYLATDAIACWIFKQLEKNQNPWLELEQISSQDLFANWVTELRDRYEIANDDTTLLCIEIRCES
jgi:hypothetical protein